MGKIGPWRIFNAKVDFSRFMYCFGRFSSFGCTRCMVCEENEQTVLNLKLKFI
jgi:hypothetical protein